MDRSNDAGRCCNIWESRLVSESSTHYPNKTCPPGYRLCLAPSIGRGTPRTCEINRAQHRAHESGRLVHSSAGNSMFKFWFLVLQLQLTILVFVRSIRSGNFPLYIQSLTKLVHWFFTFDHYHYMHGGYQFTSVI